MHVCFTQRQVSDARFMNSQNIAIPFGTEKLEWCGYTMVEKV